MTAGTLFRGLYSDLRFRIPFENFPSSKRLLDICDHIYAAREIGALELEEEFYLLLIQIYRTHNIL
ncbi:hypothetical protein GIB67_024086, partial [Kingdonia uniflora]